MSDKTHMHGDGESDSVIVPAKQPNKKRGSASGGGGGKDADQGEHGPTQPVPDAETEKLVKQVGPCA